MRRSAFSIAAFAVLAAACGGVGTTISSAPTAPTPTSVGPATTPNGGDVVLLSGTAEIPAAGGFEDPGFHEPLTLTGTIPESAAGLTGELVVRLFDIGNPDQVCDRDHPLSGCATIDWSDFEDRPSVPSGGVFDNRVRILSTAGPTEYFLSERRGLAITPDEYSPT